MLSWNFRHAIFARPTLLFALFLVSAVAAAQHTVLSASGGADLGPAPAAEKVSLRLYLVPDAAKVQVLDEFLNGLENVGSPDYHRWLTARKFGERFGPDAAAIARVRRFSEDQGLKVESVSASGLRVSISGTATQVEALFAPVLHAYAVGETHALANTQVPVIPQAIAVDVRAVGGWEAETDVIAILDDALETNSTPTVALASTVCLRDVPEAEQAAFVSMAKQAAAQGVAVLANVGCPAEGAASFPAALPGVTSVVVAQALGSAVESSGSRPAWQWAPGLPEDGLRHTPDLMVQNLSAFAATLDRIAASMPADHMGRLGNVAGALYRLAPMDGLFTQPDGGAAGTWEARTGLGVVDLKTLATVYPRGSSPVLVSGTATNYAPTHGQSTTLMSTVSDISGTAGSPAPTGTISFLQKDGTSLGTATLVSGSGSLTTNLLPGGTNPVIVTYSGDSRYSAGQGTGIYVTVLGEPAAMTATVGPTVGLGENSTVAVTVTSASGVGTPTGTVTVTPQGVGQNPPTYSAALVKSAAGTAGATVAVPGLQAGAISLLVNCVSADLAFTCYVPVHATAIVKQATSTLTFTATPNGASTGVVFVGKVTGAAAPAPVPTGPVAFYDNGSLLGTATLTAAGTATYTSAVTPSGSTPVEPRATHAYTASYFGDVNYQASAAAAPNVAAPTATTTTLTVSPNPPVTGTATTLTATVAYASTGTAATGTVQFYQDAALLGTGTVSAGGVATLTSSAITGSAAHSFYAAYAGDAVYAASQSAAVATQANTASITTTTSVSASSTTVNTGSSVTLSATVTPATSAGTPPTGTVSFTSSSQGALGVATVTGATATLTVPLTTAGAQSISATYSGDASYKASTSTTAATVTVGAVVSPVAISVSPAGNVPYSSPVTVAVSVAGIATTTGAGPAGSVVFNIAAAGSATPITATIALTPSSVTGGVAVYTFAAPAPGIYTISAVCTGTNFTCATAPVTARLVTVKGTTVTTVSGNAGGLVAGQPTTLIATVTPGSGLATAGDFTGTVTFYDASGTALGMSAVVGGQASLVTTFASVTGNVITAVYSGDVNWSGSTSASLKLLQAVSPTTVALSTNYSTALLGNNEIFTFTVTTAPTAQIPLPSAPAGQVVLYDLFNGQTITLATVNVSPSGPFASIAQFATTGLFAGLHTVTAVFIATPSFSTSSSNVRTVNVTDFTLSFSPPQLVLARGGSAAVVVTVGPVSGFAGTVSLTCAPPPDTLTSCTLSPSSVPVGGSSTLTIGTTSARVSGEQQAALRGWGLGASAAALLGCLFIPRKRRPMLAAIVLAGLIGVAGCGQTGGAGTPPVGPIGGSPLGTQSFTITTSGADGITTNRHNSQFQVTIQ